MVCDRQSASTGVASTYRLGAELRNPSGDGEQVQDCGDIAPLRITVVSNELHRQIPDIAATEERSCCVRPSGRC